MLPARVTGVAREGQPGDRRARVPGTRARHSRVWGCRGRQRQNPGRKGLKPASNTSIVPYSSTTRSLTGRPTGGSPLWHPPGSPIGRQGVARKGSGVGRAAATAKAHHRQWWLISILTGFSDRIPLGGSQKSAGRVYSLRRRRWGTPGARPARAPGEGGQSGGIVERHPRDAAIDEGMGDCASRATNLAWATGPASRAGPDDIVAAGLRRLRIGAIGGVRRVRCVQLETTQSRLAMIEPGDGSGVRRAGFGRPSCARPGRDDLASARLQDEVPTGRSFVYGISRDAGSPEQPVPRARTSPRPPRHRRRWPGRADRRGSGA